MKTQFMKFTLAAGIGLALAFTFSCSGGDDEKPDSGTEPSSSSGGDDGDGGSKGNNIANYKTVKIGSQTWMAENLNYAVEGGKCYGEDGQIIEDEEKEIYITLSEAEIQANCEKYGRLYDWATAMALPSKCNTILSTEDSDCAIKTPHRGICPSGYHIPTVTEWGTLYFDHDRMTAGKHLRAISGWNDYMCDDESECGAPYGTIQSGNGTDDYGFAALPGGKDDLDPGHYFSGFTGIGYFGSGDAGIWWIADEYSASTASGCIINNVMFFCDNDRDGGYKRGLSSIRCVKD